eukprot:6088471-Prymnesium_polylepis.1
MWAAFCANLLACFICGSGSGHGWVVGLTALISGRAKRARCDGSGLPRQPVVAQKAIPPLW